MAEGQSPTSPTAYALAGLIAAPVAIHRRFPLAALVCSTLGLVVYPWGRFSAFPGYTTFVLMFLVALHADRRRALTGYLLGVAGLSVSLFAQPATVATASSWISTVLTVTVAWLAGENLRARRARRRHELDEAHRHAGQKAEEARRAIAAERLRIARDLHDVVAHSLSVIAVQAGVAHHVIDERPQVAREAILAHHRCADVRILIPSTFDLDEYVYAALQAGASGFLVKDTPPADLLAGVLVVAGGDALLSPGITRHLIEAFVQRSTDARHVDSRPLTPRVVCRSCSGRFMPHRIFVDSVPRLGPQSISSRP